MRIAILLFDQVEELDAVGPWEVLAYWARMGLDDVEVLCLSADGSAVTCAKGLVIGAHGSWVEASECEIVIHPGGWGTRALAKDPEHLDRVRSWRQSAELMASVCTGSLVFAAAGLLHQRPATTHWQSLDLLTELDPTIEVRGQARFVDDGDVITSSGISAGIDMALHLVARYAGVARAVAVRRGIQYDPEPPI